ncbi:hypothetical protein F5Y09DRAFT_336842 [Xylaria sp. FL1042]|nr:hypothetical protein F5Y09DRAFT_336842 [Xylaria sp. FL1042]
MMHTTTAPGKRKRTETQESPEPEPERKRKRRDRQKEKETPKEVTTEWLTERGWTVEEEDLTANTAFLAGPTIVMGRLHATDKLCVGGSVAVTGKLECEGNLTLCGSLHCRATPVMVKTMIVVCKGIIHGDVVVNDGVYISGYCRVLGSLTVTGGLKIRGYLIERLEKGSRIVVDGERVINGVDRTFNQLARSLWQYHQANY